MILNEICAQNDTTLTIEEGKIDKDTHMMEADILLVGRTRAVEEGFLLLRVLLDELVCAFTNN
jgi:hypothetical protein